MRGKAADREPVHTIRSFDEFCSDYSLTATARAHLVWHLAAFRARKTVETLLPVTDPRLYGVKTDMRKSLPTPGNHEAKK